MPPIEPTPVTGAVRLTLRLDELHAITNPEAVGKAEWDLRVWINGLERWSSDELVHVGAGGTAPVGVEIITDVPAFTDELEVRVEATERDLLTRDDRAGGETRLLRVAGFEKDRPVVIDIRGKGARVELHCTVDVESVGEGG